MGYRIIGITGGIGCGKSTVCNLLYKRNPHNFNSIFHYNADKRVKELYVNNTELFNLIEKEFPEAIEYNQIIFQKLGKIVFADKSKMEILNKIVAPFIKKDFEDFAKKEHGLILLESAILINSELIKKCDYVIYVYASEKIRKERLLQRDKRSPEQLDQIFKMQSNVEEFVQNSHYIIHNSHNESYLLDEIDQFYQKIR